MKKLSNILVNIFYFLKIYSFFGCACGLVVFYALTILIEDYFKIESSLSSSKYFYMDDYQIRFNFGLALTLIIFYIIYIVLLSILVLLFRYLFIKRLLHKLSFISFKNNCVTIKFYKQPFLAPFILQCKLGLSNLTSGGFVLLSSQSPIATLTENQIVFDLNYLPSGKYSITSLKFYFKDPLNMFNAVSVYTSENLGSGLVLHESRHPISTYSSVLKLVPKDSSQSFIAKNAAEGFFKVREYLPKDEYKHIHWKASAKSAKLMIKEATEIPLDKSEIHIVMDLFSIKIKKVDQSALLADFLQKVLGTIKQLLKEFPGRSINLYINSVEFKVIKDLQSYNIDKLGEIIFDASIFQEEKNISSIMELSNLHRSYIFLVSTNKLSLSQNNTYFLYKASRAFSHSLFSSIKAILIKSKGTAADKSFGSFMYDNALYKVALRALNIRTLKRKIKENEKYYAKSKESIIYLN